MSENTDLRDPCPHGRGMEHCYYCVENNRLDIRAMLARLRALEEKRIPEPREYAAESAAIRELRDDNALLRTVVEAAREWRRHKGWMSAHVDPAKMPAAKNLIDALDKLDAALGPEPIV